MTPANRISGFKACGVYPFNPKAVLDHDPCEPKYLILVTSTIKSSDKCRRISNFVEKEYKKRKKKKEARRLEKRRIGQEES